jgi:hypothetical protein
MEQTFAALTLEIKESNIISPFLVLTFALSCDGASPEISIACSATLFQGSNEKTQLSFPVMSLFNHSPLFWYNANDSLPKILLTYFHDQLSKHCFN